MSDINLGKRFYDYSISYPIRQNTKRAVVPYDVLLSIISLLQTTDLSLPDIAKRFNLPDTTIGEINRGVKASCPKSLKYPLRSYEQKYTYSNILTKDKIKDICYMLIFTNKTFKEIGDTFGIKENTVSDISRGISWKEISNQFICPIKKNKEKNKEIYNSVYGIV